MREVKPGDVYYSHRSDIVPPKKKYQLYLDKDTVLLINTEKSKYSISVVLPQKDCPILDYDSFICIDTVFKFEKQNAIIEATQLSTAILKQLKQMVHMSALLPGYQIKRIERCISMILAEREIL